jgi:hypothetical protein
MPSWTAVTVAGLPAILAQPPSAIAVCYVAVYEPGTDVLTTVSATGAQGAFCVTVAEALLTQP